MIFSTDLDRTLLFSAKRLSGKAPVIPAEYRQMEPAGYMTPEALELLRALQTKATFLINTLRGEEQAKRVVFVGDQSCRYLSVQNGLALYRDGKLDQEWAVQVKRTVERLPLALQDAAYQTEHNLPGIECMSKMYQYLAVFFIQEEAFSLTAYRQMRESLSGFGWELVLQGKKLYVSPQEIDKGSIVKRVRELEGDDCTVGFGDSYFDIPMLRECDRAYSLRGSELEGLGCDFPVAFSANLAEQGTEEILRKLV